VDWIYLAEGRDQWWVSEKSNEPSGHSNLGFSRLFKCQFHQKPSIPWS